MDNSVVKEIRDNIIEWCNLNLYANFKFRTYQLESIIKIIHNIVYDSIETSIIEAPTGSGKSLLCIISAGVLAKYYKKSSYILCSDLFLWKQYQDFIQAYDIQDFGMLKGSKGGNYICTENNQDLTLSVCTLMNYSYTSLTNFDYAHSVGFDCAKTCEYIISRKRAIKSQVTLMTYQLWLNYVNYTDGEIFGQRDVIFCDECHNIPNIIQMFCQPTIDPKINFRQLSDILVYAIDRQMEIPFKDEKMYATKKDLYEKENSPTKMIRVTTKTFDISKYNEEILDHFNKIFSTEDKKVILEEYSSIYRMVQPVKVMADKMYEYYRKKVTNGKKASKETIKKLKLSSAVIDFEDRLFNFIDAVAKCGDECIRYIVKNNNIDKDGNKSIMFACSKEDVLCNHYMLEKSRYKVLLSATVGEKESFDDNIGIKYTMSRSSHMFRIPSTFDFSKSPIYVVPTYKMSMNLIDRNLPLVKDMIVKICKKHDSEKGIIHTGSYKNAMALYNMLPKDMQYRFHVYGSSKEKDDTLMDFDNTKNGVLVGPTLTEGIDLPDDECRFIIIMKIPYPNLGDKLVLSKIELFPKWYDSETSNSVIQAIGRGNRNPSDYCTTYILDGNFLQLFGATQSQYSDELKKRLVFLKG